MCLRKKFESHRGGPISLLPPTLKGLFAIALATFPVSLTGHTNASEFEQDVAPLLIRRCVECHQGDSPAGGLRLTSRAGLVQGGDSGPAINAEAPDHSLLLDRIHAGDMPPEKQGHSQQLPEAEIQVFERWIGAGAPWPDKRQLDYFERTNDLRAGRDWWSLQPVSRPKIPEEREQPTDNPIDAFILRRLQSQKMWLAPPADRRTLIRRLYHDLLGLPPSEAEIAAFESDSDPLAWPKLVDQLLAMPQYGERWARFWLDLARYADTSGYERDQEKPFAWKYRDWVVNAFNNDMPYDQFIIHQLAGDEIPNRSEESVIATGFLRLGSWNDEPNEPLDYQYERLEDLVHTTSSAFLGLTVKCARCHSHKFDPITQMDYYRMASAFWAGPLLTDAKRLGGPTAEALGFEDVLGWTDLGPDPDPLHVLKNGERLQPLAEVKPSTISSIPSLMHDFKAPPAGAVTTHRRLQLAQWISHPEHPLTSRVLVNRLWQHHFGQGIVRTPNNFGFLADPPTHPELLDWLAAEFHSVGRRMKPLHRLILTSRTWMQASVHPHAEEFEKTDSTNRLWWRAKRRRLDAESLRDSLLSVSGELDAKIGGSSFKASVASNALEGLSRKSAAWQASPLSEQKRRSLYMFMKRGLLPPMMKTFDLCDPTLSCGQRDETIVPTQALALLNNEFVHRRSLTLAQKIRQGTDDPSGQVRHAWSAVLLRQPTAKELRGALAHLAAQLTTFKAEPSEKTGARSATADAAKDSLVLHLRADKAILSDGSRNRVKSLPDLSGQGHHASQAMPARQPLWVAGGIGQRPSLVFEQGQFLPLSGPILTKQHFTLVCVAMDRGGVGHREILSNWNRDGNSTTSIFLGLTGKATVRFSDAFASAGALGNPSESFILCATNGPASAQVFQNGLRLAARETLPPRKLDSPWVIGQQGNINGEFWLGSIAEVRIYDRALSSEELGAIAMQLSQRYAIALTRPARNDRPDAETLALASLCHVLMNSNEFLFVD